MSSNNNDLSNKEENFHQISRVIKKSTGNQVRIKPKFYKLMGQVMNLHIDV